MKAGERAGEGIAGVLRAGLGEHAVVEIRFQLVGVKNDFRSPEADDVVVGEKPRDAKTLAVENRAIFALEVVNDPAIIAWLDSAMAAGKQDVTDGDVAVRGAADDQVHFKLAAFDFLAVGFDNDVRHVGIIEPLGESTTIFRGQTNGEPFDYGYDRPPYRLPGERETVIVWGLWGMVWLSRVVDEVSSSSGASRGDTPGVVAPPPVLFGVVFLIGFLLQRMLPWPIPLSGRAAGWFGIRFLDVSGLLALWAAGFMVHARTHINPLRPVTALVRGGPFRFSRNPLSISLVMLYVGLAFQIRSLWPLLLLAPLLLINHFGIILREERFLEAKFGDEYRNYRAAVRRWI